MISSSKKHNGLQREFIAGSLVATFCASAFGSYTSAMNPQLNINNNVEFDEKDYIIRSEDIASLEYEGGKFWGYDKNKDGKLLKEINIEEFEGISYGDHVSKLVKKYDNPKKLEERLTSLSKEDVFEVEKYIAIREAFSKKFNKEMGIKDIIFAIRKINELYNFSGDALDSLCLNKKSKKLFS